jgi:hypothetical protein
MLADFRLTDYERMAGSSDNYVLRFEMVGHQIPIRATTANRHLLNARQN